MVDPLFAAVTHALWPLVMVSATAPLVISVSSSHAAMSARIRDLAAELRDPKTPPVRLESIRQQLRCFRVRIRLSHAAHVLLYLAVLCFVSTVPVMSLELHAAGAIIGVFLVGTALLLLAILLQVVELSLADRTLDRDLSS